MRRFHRSTYQVFFLLFFVTPFAVSVSTQGKGTPFKDDPNAHALYDKMIENLRSLDTLYFECDKTFGVPGRYTSESRYIAWLKKPDYFRVEGYRVKEPDTPTGILVGDGDNLWIYWPKGKPAGYCDIHVEKYKKIYDRYKDRMYKTKPASGSMHSIGHETGQLGNGMGMTILDLSTFHGYEDSLQPYLDGVRSLGTESFGDEELAGIEVSIMDYQRSWEIWLNPNDMIPRQLKEVVRVSYDIVGTETWSNIKIDEPMDQSFFQWKPGDDWVEAVDPPMEEGLLEKGTVMPDFEFQGSGGNPIRLSDYKGKVVWLYVWRVGCPPCRVDLPKNQALYEKYKDKDFVMLGVDTADDKQIALDMMHENNITFPMILDSSNEAEGYFYQKLQRYGMSAVPMYYIIDKEGKVYDAFYGGGRDHEPLIHELLSRDPSLKGLVEVAGDETFPIRGQWDIQDDLYTQTDVDMKQAGLLFKPVATNGDIMLKARVLDGKEGVRIFFSYDKPTKYYCWNIGGRGNTTMSVEEWYTTNGDLPFYVIIGEEKKFSLEHGRWNAIRLSVRGNEGVVEGYINSEKVLSMETGKKFKGQFGLGTWQTKAEFKEVIVNVKNEPQAKPAAETVKSASAVEPPVEKEKPHEVEDVQSYLDQTG